MTKMKTCLWDPIGRGSQAPKEQFQQKVNNDGNGL